jgi:hypothetical protein
MKAKREVTVRLALRVEMGMVRLKPPPHDHERLARLAHMDRVFSRNRLRGCLGASIIEP